MRKLLRNWFRGYGHQSANGEGVQQALRSESEPAIAIPQDIVNAIEERDRRFSEGLAHLSSTGRSDWPPPYSDPFPHITRALPEISAVGLSATILGGAIAHHGALIIRNLFTPEQVAATREMQDKVKKLSESGEHDRYGWYMPFDGKAPKLRALRSRIERNGGNWLADSPLGLKQTLHFLETTKVPSTISEHFGERPAISLQKSTLRSIQPRSKPTGWHQDGSFLGKDVRSMNIWIALSECGGSTPAAGMEIIPARLEQIYHIPPDLGASENALNLVQPLIDAHSLVVPHFAPGDGIMFDEKLMHRTAFGAHLSMVRYALECWLFAPSHSAATYSPLLL
ncbi:MAG: phytanoyl-CoA dioxygenase family protein [Halioglobus sp.]|nr:phytanoyl-CoA dioxygenase family protein [Halioglobus sp.]